MKKGLIIVAEIIVIIAVAVFINSILDNYFPTVESNKEARYVSYCICGMAGAFVARKNTKKS